MAKAALASMGLQVMNELGLELELLLLRDSIGVV